MVKAIPTLFNHNGLNIDLEYPSYEWKIPRYLSGDCCVIRIRCWANNLSIYLFILQ